MAVGAISNISISYTRSRRIKKCCIKHEDQANFKATQRFDLELIFANHAFTFSALDIKISTRLFLASALSFLAFFIHIKLGNSALPGNCTFPKIVNPLNLKIYKPS